MAISTLTRSSSRLRFGVDSLAELFMTGKSVVLWTDSDNDDNDLAYVEMVVVGVYAEFWSIVPTIKGDFLKY